jgi:hypothetical protein
MQIIKIIKISYSTILNYNITSIYPIFNILKFNAPKCLDCIHYKKKYGCKYYSTFYIFARLNETKCGLKGKNFKLKDF